MIGKTLLRFVAVTSVASAFAIVIGATPRLAAGAASACNGSDRKVTVTNKSGQTIWVAALGTTQTSPPNPATCTSNSQCQANEFCDPTVSFCRSVPINGQITYDPGSSCTSNATCDPGFPICYTGNSKCGTLAQDGNGFELTDNGSRDICVPTTWGGRLWARTGCSFTQNNNTTCGGSCQGQTVTVGSACATTADCTNACVGGSNNGSACTENSQCPGVCSGGPDNGNACATGANCASPGTCNFGTCGKAFCQSGGSCCATGSCTGSQLTCSGGSNAGNNCTTALDCPNACAGGKNNGHTCTGAADCPGVCPNGARAGEQCTTNADCGGGDFHCNTGSCANAGACTKNTYSLYCTESGLAPATLAELALAAPGVCSAGGPCGPPCTKQGGTCTEPNLMAAGSDFLDVQLGIDGGNLPVVVTPVKNTYEITGDLTGVDVLDASSCTTDPSCSSQAEPYNKLCFSPTAHPKFQGPVGGKCARNCTANQDCTTSPYTECFKSKDPFAPLATGICIKPCRSNSDCTKNGFPACDVTDGVCVNAYECTSPGCDGVTGECANAGPPNASHSGAPYLPICKWDLLAQDNCPADLKVLECVGGPRPKAICRTDADCGSGGTCTKYVGCGSACSQCQPGATRPAGLKCGDPTSVTWAATNKDLYCCENSVSCFDAGKNPTAGTCCGYALWATCVGGTHMGATCGTDADCGSGGTCSGAKLPQGQATPSFLPAVGTGTWLGQAEPIEVQFKNDCPSAYSYQYDDSTSTFICGGVSATTTPPVKSRVSTAYNITFLKPSGRQPLGKAKGKLTK